MGFKRAEWHSGLTYEQTCDQCKTVVRYMDDRLGFRPWFADGFVYCPTCNKPLRHSEDFAIDSQRRDNIFVGTPGDDRPLFCPKCGNSFKGDDNFCSKCGARRD